ncbi:hypothetical protein RQP46_004788 [Phenoliferia psychrophenolica]
MGIHDWEDTGRRDGSFVPTFDLGPHKKSPGTAEIRLDSMPKRSNSYIPPTRRTSKHWRKIALAADLPPPIAPEPLPASKSPQPFYKLSVSSSHFQASPTKSNRKSRASPGPVSFSVADKLASFGLPSLAERRGRGGHSAASSTSSALPDHSFLSLPPRLESLRIAPLSPIVPDSPVVDSPILGPSLPIHHHPTSSAAPSHNRHTSQFSSVSSRSSRLATPSSYRKPLPQYLPGPVRSSGLFGVKHDAESDDDSEYEDVSDVAISLPTTPAAEVTRRTSFEYPSNNPAPKTARVSESQVPGGESRITKVPGSWPSIQSADRRGGASAKSSLELKAKRSGSVFWDQSPPGSIFWESGLSGLGSDVPTLPSAEHLLSMASSLPSSPALVDVASAKSADSDRRVRLSPTTFLLARLTYEEPHARLIPPARFDQALPALPTSPAFNVTPTFSPGAVFAKRLSVAEFPTTPVIEESSNTSILPFLSTDPNSYPSIIRSKHVPALSLSSLTSADGGILDTFPSPPSTPLAPSPSFSTHTSAWASSPGSVASFSFEDDDEEQWHEADLPTPPSSRTMASPYSPFTPASSKAHSNHSAKHSVVAFGFGESPIVDELGLGLGLWAGVDGFEMCV